MDHRPKKNVGVMVGRSGVSFRVWAPFADSVAVTGSFNNWSEQLLTSENDGYWSAIIAEAQPGQEYKFVIRRGDKVLYRNDPRALHFTTNPGNSVIAANQFDWGEDSFTPPPVDRQVIYELHVGTFFRPDAAITGTFHDVCQKLDHLASLGINMIELMPISSMLMDRGWGYAIDYIFAIESLYGGRYGFLQFVKAAHARGIGVIVDVVYNHFGPDASLDLWQFDGWHLDDKGGIYFYNDWRAETPWGNTRPDFGRPEVRQYILDNVRMWLHDCRVDGLRVDSTIFIRNVKGYNNDPATDLPEGWHMLQLITDLAKKINPAALTIAEDVADNEYIVKSTHDGGAGFTAQWELGFPAALREALHTTDAAQINLTGLCSELTRRYNNDPWQRVIYVDSHDSAANGSARFAEVVSPHDTDSSFARKQALLAATLQLTTPGIPMLFQGQEFMQGGAFTDWQAVDWQKADRHAGIIKAFQALIALRKNDYGTTAGLRGSSVNLMHVDETNKVMAYHRWQNGGAGDDTVVVINFADIAHPEYVLSFPHNGTWQPRFISTDAAFSPDFKPQDIPVVIVDNGAGSIVLPPSTAIILSQDD